MLARTPRRVTTVALAAGIGLAAAACTPPVGTIGRGPNTNTDPYIIPSKNGVDVRSLLTVDDAGSTDDGFEMVGIPDGLGAQMVDGKVVLNMNHELRSDVGIARRHGERGSFVSRFVLDPETNRVESGRDLINPGVEYYDYFRNAYDDTAPGAGTRADGKTFPAFTNAFNRFCSSSLTDEGQLFNGANGRGFLGRLYFANEEGGEESRNFAVTEEGEARQLPRLGLFSWENTLVAPTTNDTTLTQGNEDNNPGQLWAYVGRKVGTGSPFQRAGLLNGRNYTLNLNDAMPANVTSVPPTTGTPATTTDAGFRARYNKGQSVPFVLNDVEWNQSGADQNAEAVREGGLSLNRIEDGAFDPNSPNDYYFVTTDGGEGPGQPASGGGGGLWRMSYANVNTPLAGGTLTLLLDGTEMVGGTPRTNLQKPDNMDIDTEGNLLIQEDPGNTAPIARVVSYRLSDGALGAVAQFDPRLFAADSETRLTMDEESSGIIDVADIYGPGSFLLDAQVHESATITKSVPPTTDSDGNVTDPGRGPEGTVDEFVERGQLLLMKVSDFSKVYGS